MGRIVDPSEVILAIGLSAAITEEERAIVETQITMAEGAVRRFLQYDPTLAARTEYYPSADLDYANRDFVWEVDSNNAYQRRVSSAVTDELQLRHIPVRASTAPQVFIDYDGRFGQKSGAFAASTEKTIGEDFWVDYDGNDDAGDAISFAGILRSIGQWPTNPGSVKVVYTAGYSEAELHGKDSLVDASPIVDAVIDESTRRVIKTFQRRKLKAGWVAGTLESERLGDYNYKIGAGSSEILTGGVYDLMPETQEKLDPFMNIGWAMSGA